MNEAAQSLVTPLARCYEAPGRSGGKQKNLQKQLLSRNEHFVIILVAQLVLAVAVTGKCIKFGNSTAVMWAIHWVGFLTNNSVLELRFEISDLEKVTQPDCESEESILCNISVNVLIWYSSSWSLHGTSLMGEADPTRRRWKRKRRRRSHFAFQAPLHSPPRSKCRCPAAVAADGQKKAACRQIPDQRLEWECGCRVTLSPNSSYWRKWQRAGRVCAVSQGLSPDLFHRSATWFAPGINVSQL